MKPTAGSTADEVLAVALQKLALRPGVIFADIGCGSGKVSIAASPLVREVYAIDRRPESVAFAREQAIAAGVGNPAKAGRPTDVGNATYVGNIRFLEGEAPGILDGPLPLAGPSSGAPGISPLSSRPSPLQERGGWWSPASGSRHLGRLSPPCEGSASSGNPSSSRWPGRGIPPTGPCSSPGTRSTSSSGVRIHAHRPGPRAGRSRLLTLRAVRLLREADAVFVPGGIARNLVAPYRDAEVLSFPMSDDDIMIQQAVKESAERIARVAGEGLAVFALLGDPNVYSTYSRLSAVLQQRYPDILCATVPGISAITAFASVAGVTLSGAFTVSDGSGERGRILLKVRRPREEAERLAREGFREFVLVERMFLNGERVYRGELPESSTYLSVLFAGR